MSAKFLLFAVLSYPMWGAQGAAVARGELAKRSEPIWAYPPELADSYCADFTTRCHDLEPGYWADCAPGPTPGTAEVACWNLISQPWLAQSYTDEVLSGSGWTYVSD